MTILYNLGCLLLVAATALLGYLLGNGLRRAWAVRLLLHSPEHLEELLAPPFLDAPPENAARWLFADAHGGPPMIMDVFLRSDRIAAGRAENIVRVALVLCVLGAGVLGFVADGPWGLLWPIAGVALFLITFQPSRPAVSEVALESAREYLQALALILARWRSVDVAEVEAWLAGEHAYLTPLYRSVVAARAPKAGA